MNIFQKTRPTTRHGGFTILEVMIAISILAIGLLAVFSTQTSSIRANNNANRLTEGMTLAQDKMEELLALSYDDLDATGSPVTDPGGYTISWTVDDTVFSNAKLITVTVSREDIIRQPLVLTCIRTRL
jgi:prepilin-type N-terminal cleavage/methylation domain-containing protein